MIKFICHPILTNLLEQSRVEMKFQDTKINIVTISDFIPQTSNSVYCGLLESVKYRLKHPNHYIIFLSFQSKKELLLQDTLGILSLKGTIFIRLPFVPAQIITNIEENINIDLLIPLKEWNEFSTNAYKLLIKEKLRELKHGEKLDFVNNITGPLFSGINGSSKYPEVVPAIKRHLNLVIGYNSNEEIAELFSMANACKSLHDEFLQSFSQFVDGLRLLELCASEETLNIRQLFSVIDTLNKTSSKIQTL